MFSEETVKKGGKVLGTFIIVLAALAFHQVVIAPHLVKKPKTATPPVTKL